METKVKHVFVIIILSMITTFSVGDTLSTTVKPKKEKLSIDGKLTESCWKRKADFSDFHYVGRKQQKAATRTRGWITCDKDWLYLAFECDEPKIDKLKTDIKSRDACVNKDDSVEVFISPGTDGETYYHFITTAQGVQGDNRSEKSDHHIHWDGHWRSAATVDKKHRKWYAEMAIPLLCLNKNKGKKAWKINVARNRNAGLKEFNSWAPVAGTYHDPKRFGTLKGLEKVSNGKVFAPVIVSAKVGELIDLPVRGYEVTMTVRNDGNLPGNIDACAYDITESGEQKSKVEKIKLQPGHEKTFKIMIPIAEYEKRSSRAEIGIKDNLGRWNFSKDLSFGRSTEPFYCAMDRSYYTFEKKYYVVCRVNMPEKALQNLEIQINAPFLKKEMVFPVKDSTSRYKLPIVSMIKPGTYNVKVVLKKKEGKVIGEKKCELVKRISVKKGNEVKVDRWNLCILLNGKPFFPYGFYRAPIDNIGLMKEAGANAAINWRKKTADELIKVLDEAEKNQIYLLASPLPEITLNFKIDQPKVIISELDKSLPEVIKKVAPHPALLVWHMYDEPYGDRLRDALLALHDAVHELDGYHPAITGAYILLSGDPKWQQLIDFGFPHHYWNPHGPEKKVPVRYLDVLDNIHKASLDNMKPFWFGVSNEFYSITRRMQKPQERRLNVYLAIINGATGIFYFAWPPLNRETMVTQKKIAEEIKIMSPAILRRSPLQKINVKNKDPHMIEAVLKQYPNGDGLLLAGNTYNSKIKVKLTISGLSDADSVSRLFGKKDSSFFSFLFGDDNLAVDNNSFDDVLEPYGTRAYKIDGMNISGPVKIDIIPQIIFPKDEKAKIKNKNLVPNCSFEEEKCWSIKDKKNVTFDNKTARSGKRCLRFDRPDSAIPSSLVFSDPITLKPGTKYRIGAWIKGKFKTHPPRWGGPAIRIWNQTDPKNHYYIQSHAHYLKDWYRRVHQYETGNKPETIKLALEAAKGKFVGTAWFDDVFIEEISLPPSRNLLPNSGFEHASAPETPDRWRAQPNSELLTIETLTPGEKALFCQDFAEKIEGKCSCRLRGRQWFHSSPTRPRRGVILEPNTNYVFSIYMKADVDKLKVKIRLKTGIDKKVRQPWNEFIVGKKWQRYTAKFKTGKGRNLLHITMLIQPNPKSDNIPTLWLDAGQVEKGSKPTEYVKDVYNPESMEWMALENR